MDEDVERVGGYRRDTIDLKDEAIRKDVTRLWTTVYGNGQPGLEERIKRDLKEIIDHKMSSRAQAEGNLHHLIQNEERDRKKDMETFRHDMHEMGKTIGDLKNSQAKYAGAIAIIAFVTPIVTGIIIRIVWK